jgi:hypothetical protein
MKQVKKTTHKNLNPKDYNWIFEADINQPLMWRKETKVYFAFPEGVLNFFRTPLREVVKTKNLSFSGVEELSFMDEKFYTPSDPLWGLGGFLRANPDNYNFCKTKKVVINEEGQKIEWRNCSLYTGLAIRVIANRTDKDHQSAKKNFVDCLEAGHQQSFTDLSSESFFFPIGKCTIVLAMVKDAANFERDVASVLKHTGELIPTEPQPFSCGELFVGKAELLKWKFMEVECPGERPFHGYSTEKQRDCILNAVINEINF